MSELKLEQHILMNNLIHYLNTIGIVYDKKFAIFHFHFYSGCIFSVWMYHFNSSISVDVVQSFYPVQGTKQNLVLPYTENY
jgi:hypothetical protein